MSKLFTLEEIQFIKDNYPINGAKYCAEALNRTIASINLKASKLRVRALERKITHEEYNERLFNIESPSWPTEPYITLHTSITHECLEGHIWKAAPANILRGSGCPTCARHGFDATKPATLYYVKLTKANETYYKVGITNNNVDRRFHGDKDKTIVIIAEWKYDKGYEAKVAEKEILAKFKDKRVSIPGFLNIGGHTELFEYDILGLDN